MEFLDVLQTYFRGERLESACFIAPAGLILFAIAIAALRSETPTYAWSVAAPCFVFGLLLVVVGVAVAARTPGQVAALVEGLQSSRAATLSEELARMDRVVRNFHVTQPVFGALALLGLVLRFGLKAEWAQGLGSVLALAGAMGLMIDGFASRRAEPYLEALKAEVEVSGAAPPG